jgi:hypothetical protein
MTHATQNIELPAAALKAQLATRRSNRLGRAVTPLTWLVAALALTVSLVGLVVDGIYAGAVSTAEMLRGYDVVTAMVVVPSLVVAGHLARRGSVAARLVTASLLAYLVYTYAYYLFGTGFNDLFLLHVVVFASALFALLLAIATIDVTSTSEGFRPDTRARSIAGILGVLAVGLGGMWVYFAVNNAVTGKVPAGSQLVETDTVVHLGMALDLALLVPLYAAAAALLWRHAAWGYVLAAVALIAGVLHQLSYIVAMPFQVAAGVSGAVSYDPVEPVIVLLYLVATALLLHGARRASTVQEGG